MGGVWILIGSKVLLYLNNISLQGYDRDSEDDDDLYTVLVAYFQALGS